MNQESPCTDIQSRLSRIEEKLDKINRTINPPFWLVSLHWIGRNFFTILTLITLLIMGYKAWDLYQNLQEQIETIKLMPVNAVDTGKDALQNVVEKLKFW